MGSRVPRKSGTDCKRLPCHKGKARGRQSVCNLHVRLLAFVRITYNYDASDAHDKKKKNITQSTYRRWLSAILPSRFCRRVSVAEATTTAAAYFRGSSSSDGGGGRGRKITAERPPLEPTEFRRPVSHSAGGRSANNAPLLTPAATPS